MKIIDSIIITQTLGLSAMLIVSLFTFKKAKATETRLNSGALIVGSALGLYANIEHWIDGEFCKTWYQAGITIIIIVSAGMVVSLRNLERI